jgi:hypothetical protein
MWEREEDREKKEKIRKGKSIHGTNKQTKR